MTSTANPEHFLLPYVMTEMPTPTMIPGRITGRYLYSLNVIVRKHACNLER